MEAIAKTIANVDDERLGLPSASNFYRLVACPGSLQLIRSVLPPGISHDEPSNEAARGTRIHRALETGSTLDLSEEETEAYERLRAMANEHRYAWIQQKGIGEPNASDRILLEERYWLHDTQCRPICSAKIDYLEIASSKDGQTRILIMDYKTGAPEYIVAAQRNWQLRCAAVAAAIEHDCKDIRAVLVHEGSRSRTDYVDYGARDLEFADMSIRFALSEAHQPEPPIFPGAHCHFCPVKPFCAGAAAFAMLPISAYQTSVEALTGRQLRKIWDADPTIRGILDAVTARLKSFPAEELNELGLLLPEHGRKNDRISDILGAFNRLRDEGFTDEEILKAMEFHTGRLTELIQNKTQNTRPVSKAKAEGWITEQLDSFITRGFAAPSLKRIPETKYEQT